VDGREHPVCSSTSPVGTGWPRATSPPGAAQGPAELAEAYGNIHLHFCKIRRKGDYTNNEHKTVNPVCSVFTLAPHSHFHLEEGTHQSHQVKSTQGL
jgi:hypothetical protein